MMAVDETACDDFSTDPPTAGGVAAALAGASNHISEAATAGSEAAGASETKATKQPTETSEGAHSEPVGAALHPATFVGCADRTNCAKIHQANGSNNVNSDQRPHVSPRRKSKNPRGSLVSQQQQQQQQQAKSPPNNQLQLELSQSQSQTRINHSLESINSRYSSSSANDDSASVPAPNATGQSLRAARLSTSQASSCSPIEAQLASSTCDLGINLIDGVGAGGGGWRGSFSALGSPTPTREPAKSLVAFMGLVDRRADDDWAADEAACKPKDRHPAAGGGGGSRAGPATATGPVNELRPPFMFAGVLASIVGSVFFSLSVLCIKLLPNQEGFTEKVKALCFRGVFMTILCGVAILVQRSTFIVRRNELLVNILRAVFGTCGVLGLYSALSYISMGDATALIFSSPVWTSILSHFILKEPLQWLQLIALPASLFGIVLIAHPALIVDVEQQQQQQHTNDSAQLFVAAINGSPPESVANSSLAGNYSMAYNQSVPSVIDPALGPSSFDFEHRWPGIVIALATSLLVSCVYIALKFRKTTPIQTTTFWFGMFMILASLALQCFTGPIDIPPTVYEWALLFGNGVTSWLGQSFLQWAFLYEEAGVLSIVRTLDVAMTFMLSSLFLDEEILWTSIVGATIIGLVVVSIMLNEWIKKLSCSQRKNSNILDQRLSFELDKNQANSSLNNSSLSKSSNARQSDYAVASKA